MENKQLFILENTSGMRCVICGGKEKISYLSKMAAEREIRLSVKSGRKGLYIGNVSVTADAPFCRIGLESLPYPRKKCINVSTCLSVKKNTKEKSEVGL